MTEPTEDRCPTSLWGSACTLGAAPHDWHRSDDGTEWHQTGEYLLRARTGSATVVSLPCDDCRSFDGLLGAGWMADDDIWTAVVGDEPPVLCPRCFVQRARQAGYGLHGWRLSPLGPAEECTTDQGDTP